MIVTDTSEKLHRRWVRVLLVTAITAGTLGWGGAGLGSTATAPTVTDVVVDVDVDSGSVVWINWRVHNATGQTLTSGAVTQAERTTSTVDVAGLKPGEFRSGFYEAGSWAEPNYSMVKNVCYDHKGWSYWDGSFGWDTFRTSAQKWRDIYIFVRDGALLVTPEGAFDDRHLVSFGAC